MDTPSKAINRAHRLFYELNEADSLARKEERPVLAEALRKAALEVREGFQRSEAEES